MIDLIIQPSINAYGFLNAACLFMSLWGLLPVLASQLMQRD